MDVAWLMTHRRGLRVDCSCGHSAQFDGLDIALAVGETTPVASVFRRLRCTRCMGRDLKTTITDKADGSPLLMSEVTQNIFHRCTRDPCFAQFWLTPGEAQAFGSMTFADYAKARACPTCGTVGGRISARLTDDPIPGPVAPMFGRGAKARR